MKEHKSSLSLSKCSDGILGKVDKKFVNMTGRPSYKLSIPKPGKRIDKASSIKTPKYIPETPKVIFPHNPIQSFIKPLYDPSVIMSRIASKLKSTQAQVASQSRKSLESNEYAHINVA
jgi:hypothetical protein